MTKEGKRRESGKSKLLWRTIYFKFDEPDRKFQDVLV